MDFSFSREEEDVRSAVREFVQKELAERDLDQTGELPVHILRQMSDLGFLSLKMAEEYGGEPASWVDIGILVEETAKGDISLAYFTIVSYLAGLSLSARGERRIAEKWVPELVKGRKHGSISLTEPDAGCDTSTMATVAVRDGECYVINGTKCPVSFGMQADFTILFASTVSESGATGMTGFFVPLDLPGVKRVPLAVTGLLSSTPASLTFDNVVVPLVNRLGQEGEGPDLDKNHCFSSDLSQILCALATVGLSQAALKLAVSYSKKRMAFGRPIGQFEALSGRIAEDAVLIEAGRWLCYRSLSLKDRGLQNTKEAAMCGLFCPRNAYRIIEDALLIHGHSGYSDDHPFQQMLRDVLAFQIIAGTEQMLQLAIAVDVIGKVALPKEMATTAGRGQ